MENCAFCNLTSLEYLILKENNFKKLDFQLIKDLKNLTVLDLSGNQIEKVFDNNDLANSNWFKFFNILYLNYNKIQNI